MPIEKPTKPTELVPRVFGGIKNNFSDDLQSTGFEPNIPQTYNGDNLNYHLDATGKELDYVEKVVDFINQAPVNHIPFVNENNQLDYVNKDELGGGGLEVGDIGIAPLGLDETQNKRRYLNGQIVIQEQYVEFTNKVKSAVALYPSLACTESEWQTTATMTVGGQCGKFVVDEEVGTIRLPKIIMPIQGLTDLSKLAEIVEAGLPNITAQATVHQNQMGNAEGAFSFEDSSRVPGHTNTTNTGQEKLLFDASLSNPIYGNSLTVQQEQIQYPYFIQVATGASESIDTTRATEINSPFFFGMSQYFESTPNNPSWVKSTGTYLSKAVYPDYYDWLLKIYNGTETQEGVSVKEVGAIDITDYDFEINQTDETFRLPLKTYKSDDSISELDLYYYIGEGIVNPQLVNVARIEETKANKTDVDGQWVLTPYTAVVENVTLGANADRVVDLSSYLPNDGHFYQINATISHVSAEQGSASVTYQDSNGNVLDALSARSQVANQRASAAGFIIVGTDRKTHCVSGSVSVAQFYLILRGYRRLGTNQ